MKTVLKLLLSIFVLALVAGAFELWWRQTYIVGRFYESSGVSLRIMETTALFVFTIFCGFVLRMIYDYGREKKDGAHRPASPR